MVLVRAPRRPRLDETARRDCGPAVAAPSAASAPISATGQRSSAAAEQAAAARSASRTSWSTAPASTSGRRCRADRRRVGPDAWRSTSPRRSCSASASARRWPTRGWGRIINIASQQAIRAFGNSGGYGASKGGLVSLTRSQSEAWAPRGVCCNAIAPGFVATPLTREAASDPARSAALAARTMIGRNGEAADFEGIAVFLASPASGYVTGQLIFVDGGFSAT